MTNSKIKINMDSLKSRREWKRHKVKDGHNIFRILPPFGESSNGYPYRKYQVIWGLTDPESGRLRPFASSILTEKRCPVVEFVAKLKKRADDIESKMKTKGSSEEEIKVRLKNLRELINDLTPKTVYVYNAVDKGGDVGLLELKSTAHKKMKEVMNQYIQDYNQDPTSLGSAEDDSGVWMDVTRRGEGRDTEYDVVKCQIKTKTAQGLMFVDDRSPLPESVVENYDSKAYDLSSVYQLKTYDELQEALDANLVDIVKSVPDADISLSLGTTVSIADVPVINNSKVSTKVTTKIDDSGDDDDDSSSGTGSSNNSTRISSNGNSAMSAIGKAQVGNVDDDIRAMADAIFNE